MNDQVGTTNREALRILFYSVMSSVVSDIFQIDFMLDY